MGDYAAARRYLLAALLDAAHYDYPDRTTLALGALGDVCRRQHQWAAARTYFTRSRAISQRINALQHVLAMEFALALLREDQGQYAAAAEGQQVLVRLRATNLLSLVPLAQALQARAALCLGQVPAAIAYGRQSLAGSQPKCSTA